MEIINYIIANCTEFISCGGIFVGFFLVMIESFIPALPLSVFVALNVNAFGFFIGCLISWIATSLGSYICYSIFAFVERKLTSKFLDRNLVKKIMSSIDRFSDIKFPELVLLITLPFTPSFLVNILCGLTRMDRDKYLGALLLGKVFSIIFWGYIGKSLIESLTDINSIVFIILTLVISYGLSKSVSHKLNIE